jgi:hypothetical protein
MMELVFLRDLSLAVLGLVFSVLGAILLRRYVPLLRGRDELLFLQDLARIAVAAAEQIGESRGLSGEEKKILALTMVRAGLERVGIEVSDEELEAVIEAMVRMLREL